MQAQPPAPAPDDTVPPGDDSNTDPTPPLPADLGRNGAEREPSALFDEEPELHTGELGIPSDGRDPLGEAMIRDLHKAVESGGEKSKGASHGH